MKFIPYGKQKIDHNDIKLIRKAAFSDKITTGKFVKLLKKIKIFLMSSMH